MNQITWVNRRLARASSICYRLDIIPIRDRVVTPAEYDEEGSVITEPVYAGETRVDIKYYPEAFEEKLPELATQVNPKTPDMRYA